MALMVGSFVMFGVQDVDAAFVMAIDDSGTAGIDAIIIDNTDGGAETATTMRLSTHADFPPIDGNILYIGAIGAFSLNVTTGTSKAGDAKIYLNSTNISTAVGGRLDIWLTDTDFSLTS
jgi:hypothetical protein